MTRLAHRGSRTAWWWCRLHTVVVPAPLRERRRAELLSHLWEAEQAGVDGRRLLGATARGAFADVAWSIGRGAGPAASSAGFWVALAAALPVWALAVSTFAGEATARSAERVGMLGSLLLLGLSGLVLVLRRR